MPLGLSQKIGEEVQGKRENRSESDNLNKRIFGIKIPMYGHLLRPKAFSKVKGLLERSCWLRASQQQVSSGSRSLGRPQPKRLSGLSRRERRSGGWGQGVSGPGLGCGQTLGRLCSPIPGLPNPGAEDRSGRPEGSPAGAVTTPHVSGSGGGP